MTDPLTSLLRPRRSLLASIGPVAARALVLGLLVFVVGAFVQQAMGALARMPARASPLLRTYYQFVALTQQRETMIRLLAVWCGCVDLPVTYLLSNQRSARGWWAWLMWLPPVAFTLTMVLGFFAVYVQYITNTLQGLQLPG